MPHDHWTPGHLSGKDAEHRLLGYYCLHLGVGGVGFKNRWQQVWSIWSQDVVCSNRLAAGSGSVLCPMGFKAAASTLVFIDQ